MVRIKVPATTANIGPGFDSLGCALSLYAVIDFEETDAGWGSIAVVVSRKLFIGRKVCSHVLRPNFYFRGAFLLNSLCWIS